MNVGCSIQRVCVVQRLVVCNNGLLLGDVIQLPSAIV